MHTLIDPNYNEKWDTSNHNQENTNDIIFFFFTFTFAFLYHMGLYSRSLREHWTCGGSSGGGSNSFILLRIVMNNSSSKWISNLEWADSNYKVITFLSGHRDVRCLFEKYALLLCSFCVVINWEERTKHKIEIEAPGEKTLCVVFVSSEFFFFFWKVNVHGKKKINSSVGSRWTVNYRKHNQEIQARWFSISINSKKN